MAPLPTMISVATAAIAFVAAIWDVQTRRIPNWLSGFALAIVLALQFCDNGWHTMAPAMLASGIAGGVFLIFFLAGGMGGGDVKLIAAVAAGVGLRNVGALLVFTSICGGVMAVALAMHHGRLRQTLGNVRDLTAYHAQSGIVPHPEWHVRNARALRLPYAVAIAAGTFLTLTMQGIQG